MTWAEATAKIVEAIAFLLIMAVLMQSCSGNLWKTECKTQVIYPYMGTE